MSDTQAGAAYEPEDGASTDPITLDPIKARLIGDQLRAIIHLATTLSETIRQKKLPTPFHPDDVKAIADTASSLLRDLSPVDEDGGGGK